MGGGHQKALSLSLKAGWGMVHTLTHSRGEAELRPGNDSADGLGAAAGRGLGDDFLRHVARCASALHVVDASSEDPVGDLETVRGEIERFGLNELPFRVLLSKCDLVTSERLSELEGALSNYPVSAASSTSGDGLGEAALQIRRLAHERRPL